MFDMNKIGIKIASLRKENNMTQMELADKLGISYQAVSNWERGNSMPDISKLPELANIFNVSINDIIEDDSNLNLVKNIAEDDIDTYLQQNEITAEDIIDTAPILKPNQLDTVLNHTKLEFDLGQLLSLAPFIGKESVDKCILNLIESNKDIDLRKLVALAPFASKEIISKCVSYIVEHGNSNVGIGKIIALAPFMTKDALSKVALIIHEKTGLHHFVALAPFIDKGVMTQIVENDIKKNGFSNTLYRIIPLLPFLEKDSLKRWFERGVV